MIRVRDWSRFGPQPAQAGEIARLVAQANRMVDAPVRDVAAFIERFDPMRDGAVSVSQDGRLVGFAAFAGGPDTARLRWLGAAAEAATTGLPAALLDACVHAAARLGHRAIETCTARPGAAVLLRAAGFTTARTAGLRAPRLWSRALAPRA